MASHWSPAKIKQYIPSSTAAPSRSERTQLKHQKQIADAQYIQEIAQLERRLANIQRKKHQHQHQQQLRQPPSTFGSKHGDASLATTTTTTTNHEGKDPAFFTILSPAEVVACEECGQEMPLNRITKHMRTTCNGRYVHCLKPGCSARFRATDRSRHEQFECKTVAKNKRFARAASTHLNPMQCPLGCDMGVTRKDIPRHTLTICPKRKIDCPHEGCSIRLSIPKMKIHAATECVVGMKRNTMAESSNQRRLIPVQCSPDHDMGCGQMILPKDMQKHEQIECPHRLTLCSNKGCNEMIALNILSFHQDNICKAMLAQEQADMKKEEQGKMEYACPLGCG